MSAIRSKGGQPTQAKFLIADALRAMADGIEKGEA